MSAATAPGFYVIARVSAFEPEARAMFIAESKSARRHLIGEQVEPRMPPSRRPDRQPATQPLSALSQQQPLAGILDEPRRRAISEATAKTWRDPDIAARRKRRHMAVVDGVTYSSLAAALRALGADTSLSKRLSTGLRRRLHAAGGCCEFEGREVRLVERRS